MKVLVCGSRDFADEKLLFDALDVAHEFGPITQVIHGAARGADTLAGEWAEGRIPVRAFPAKWGEYGRAAGPIRNRQMLVEGEPDVVIAFFTDEKTSRGTANMVKQARGAGVPVKTFESSLKRSAIGTVQG